MSKLKTEGTGGFLLTSAEQAMSLGLGPGVQMHLQGCRLFRLCQWYIQDWLAGGCVVSASLTPGPSDTQTCCLCGRLFLGKVGYKGRKVWLLQNCWATDTLLTSWWSQGSAPIPEGWAGFLNTERGIQTVSLTAQTFGHPQHRDRDSETRGPLGKEKLGK